MRRVYKILPALCFCLGLAIGPGGCRSEAADQPDPSGETTARAQAPDPAPAPSEADPAPAPSEAAPAPPVEAPATDGLPRPLTPQERAIFTGSPDEPAPAVMTDPIDYVHTNETRHDLYFPFIEGLGGGYVGVGSDQNYILAARARSELIWLMDYNITVARMHRVVRALVLAAPDAGEYQSLWRSDARERARSILEKSYRDDPDRAEVVATYERFQAKVERYHQRTLPRAQKGWSSLWLHDPGTYEYMRAMFRAGRVRSLRGDLLGAAAMKGIARSARELGVTVRVIYLSNAESFFPYEPSFRENLAALPIDDGSVVLRTAGARVFGRSKADFNWHYNVQKATHFVGLLGREAKVRKVYDMLHAGRESETKGLSTTGFGPGELPRRGER